MVAARVDVEKPTGTEIIAQKLAMFCGIKEDAVVVMPNVKSVYEVPLGAIKAGVLEPLNKFIDQKEPDMREWEELTKRIRHAPSKVVRVGIVGAYVENPDAYLSVVEALRAAGWAEGIEIEVVWGDSDTVNGIVVADGEWNEKQGIACLELAGKGHPEFRSRPIRPHPLFLEFVKSLQ
jgi:CTP synthase